MVNQIRYAKEIIGKNDKNNVKEWFDLHIYCTVYQSPTLTIRLYGVNAPVASASVLKWTSMQVTPKLFINKIQEESVWVASNYVCLCSPRAISLTTDRNYMHCTCHVALRTRKLRNHFAIALCSRSQKHILFFPVNLQSSHQGIFFNGIQDYNLIIKPVIPIHCT